MKKDTPKSNSDDLRPEYAREELSGGVRGKHLDAYRKGANIALLAPELRAAFPSDEAVNEAPRAVLEERKGRA